MLPLLVAVCVVLFIHLGLVFTVCFAHPRCVQIGLGKAEVFHIQLALKKLTQKHPLALARFWGE